MAYGSRTQQRSSTPRGRWGRSSSARSAPTSGRSLRAGSGEAGAKGRFGLGGSLGPSGYGRPSPGRRRNASSVAGWRDRSRSKSKQESGVGKALSALTAMSGGKAAKKTSSRGAKPAGFALLAGAAGLALKNREKLMGMTHRGGESNPSGTATTSDAYSGPTPGPQEDNRSVASPPGTTEGTTTSPPHNLSDAPEAGDHRAGL